MSPTRRPSSVAALRRGVGAVQSAAAPVPAAADVPDHSPRPVKPKDARVTLNMPPQLYRDLQRWADTMAEALDVPRVGVQVALRGMIREVTSNPAISAKITHAVREELATGGRGSSPRP